MKKLIALLMTISMLFSVSVTAAGCKKSTSFGDGDDVVIQFQLDNLGFGTQWLAESCDRFMEQQKDVEYPGGKKGVYCHIVRGNTPTANNIQQSGSHVVFAGGTGNSLAQTGNIWNMDEVVTEMEIPGEPGKKIVDKLYDQSKSYYRAGDTYAADGTLIPGDYYTLPTHENYAGFSYDKEVFDRYGFYFARTLDGAIIGDSDYSYSAYVDTYGTNIHSSELMPNGENVYEFVMPKPVADVEGWAEGKSCGPNGIYGDYDDGLPSSLYELFVLWEYMAKNKVSPVLVSGFQQSLSNAILDSLPSALMGYEKARGQLDLTGNVDAVIGFSYKGLNDQGLKNLEAPIVQSVEVTEESGYYTTWAVERYFTMAAMELLVEKGYLDPASYKGGEAELNHLGAQKKFIDSGYSVLGGTGKGDEVGMLMEYSYWWNESAIRGNVDAFEALNPDVVDREIRWMPYPVNIKTSVTGEDEEVSYRFADLASGTLTGTCNREGTEYTESKKGEKNILVQAGNAGLIVNKKLMEQNEAERQAVIDWLLFFHSDKELSAVTAQSGFRKSLKYEMQVEDRSKWASFYADLYELSEKSDIIRHCSDNETFNANVRTIFSRSEGNEAWKCAHGNYFACYRNTPDKTTNGGRSSRRCFINIMVTEAEWATYYKGGKGDNTKITHVNYKDGTPVIFIDGDGGAPV